MPKFIVKVQRTIIQICDVEVSGKDEDAATNKVEVAYAKLDWAGKQDWELDSEEFEVIEVNEE